VNSEEGIWSIRVKSLEADESIDYTKEGFTKGGKTYDITFDTVGKSLFSDCLRLAKSKTESISGLSTSTYSRYFEGYRRPVSANVAVISTGIYEPVQH